MAADLRNAAQGRVAGHRTRLLLSEWAAGGREAVEPLLVLLRRDSLELTPPERELADALIVEVLRRLDAGAAFAAFVEANLEPPYSDSIARWYAEISPSATRVAEVLPASVAAVEGLLARASVESAALDLLAMRYPSVSDVSPGASLSDIEYKLMGVLAVHGDRVHKDRLAQTYLRGSTDSLALVKSVPTDERGWSRLFGKARDAWLPILASLPLEELAAILRELLPGAGESPWTRVKAQVVLLAAADPGRSEGSEALRAIARTAQDRPELRTAAWSLEIASGYWNGGHGLPVERLFEMVLQDEATFIAALGTLPPAWRMLELARVAASDLRATGSASRWLSSLEMELFKGVRAVTEAIAIAQLSRRREFERVRAELRGISWPTESPRAQLVGLALRLYAVNMTSARPDELDAEIGASTAAIEPGTLPPELRDLYRALIEIQAPGVAASVISKFLESPQPFRDRSAADVMRVLSLMDLAGAEPWLPTIYEIAKTHPGEAVRRAATHVAVTHTRSGAALDAFVTPLVASGDAAVIAEAWSSFSRLDQLTPALDVRRLGAWLEESLASNLPAPTARTIVDSLDDVAPKGSSFAAEWGAVLTGFSGGPAPVVTEVRSIGARLRAR